jgi:hypothetical protein
MSATTYLFGQHVPGLNGSSQGVSRMGADGHAFEVEEKAEGTS